MPTTVADLLKGKDPPLCTRPDDALPDVVGTMLEHDYSQLPVVDEYGKVLGIVSSDLILRALSGFKCALAELNVKQAMDRVSLLRAEDDVFELLRRLEDSGAVVIVDRDRIVAGIITNFDTTDFFHDYAESLMLVEDIETAMRDHILAAFSTQDGLIDSESLNSTIETVLVGEERELTGRLRQAISTYLQHAGDPQVVIEEGAFDRAIERMIDRGEPKEFDELSFYEYQALLLSGGIWAHCLGTTGLSRESVQSMLDDVREIRNFLFHFKGQLDKRQREALRLGSAWFANNQPILAIEVPVISEAEVSAHDQVEVLMESSEEDIAEADQPELIPSEEEIEPQESRYVPLALWLERYPRSQEKVKLSFDQIEEIIDDHLPASANNHRSWWANDTVSHVQSRQWLGAGWRVASVNLSSGHVTFSRIEDIEKRRIGFYSILQNRLENLENFPLKDTSPSGAPWFVVARIPQDGRQQAILGFSFVRNERFRAELYIDTGNQVKNKQVFDQLHSWKQDIERDFRGELSWEPMNSRRASRVAAYQDGSIVGSDGELDELNRWGVDAIVRLKNAIWDRTHQALSG